MVLEKAINADIYIFRGDDRTDAESMIEKGDKLYPGNPLRLEHHDDLLIVFTKASILDVTDGSFKLTYETSGDKHAFWRRPFLDEDVVYWYIALSSTCILLIALIYLVVHFLCFRPCCLKKPICCCNLDFGICCKKWNKSTD